MLHRRTRLFHQAALVTLITGCSKTVQPIASPPAIAEPTPPTAASRDQSETIWRLRAALNVAALSCSSRSPSIVKDYNTLLKVRKTTLATAYQARAASFRENGGADWQASFDRDTTRLYNHYASPPAQLRLCAAADAIAAEALNVPQGSFPAFAATAVDRIEQALLAPPTASVPPVARTSPPLAIATASDWRIQLGAYTGASAASAAWAQIKARLPGMSHYVPHYEAVPARPALVRLQIGNPADRAGALTLCALAAAGGFDCLPVKAR